MEHADKTDVTVDAHIWGFRHLFAICLLGTALLALSGCASMGPNMAETRPLPVRVGSIVDWSKQAVPTNTIIDRIRNSGTVYHVNASEIINLHKEGVANIVLDYMQATYVDAVSRNRERMDIRQWHRYNDGYYYGGVGYGWERPSFNFAEEEGGDDGDQ